jgi:hypothetical protein
MSSGSPTWFRLAGAQELASRVDVENLLPLRHGHVDRGDTPLQAGVGREDADRAELVDRRGDHLDHLVLLGYVRLVRVSPHTEILDLSHYLPGGSATGDAVDHDQETAAAIMIEQGEETSHATEQLGILPQAFTHLSLISVGFDLDRSLG